jgi:hypothetical protein
MKKLTRITALAGVALIVLGSGLFAFYILAGQSLTPEGFLVEEFAAGALGVLALLLGLVAIGVAGIMALVARRKH